MKSMKKKILLSSIVTIAICFCLIVGSTYALFTSESEMNIAITSGNVELKASINEYELWSVRPSEAGDPFETVDENGNGYVYEQQQNGTFANGGTAALNNEGNELTLSKITPGDKVVINIASVNTSDVIIKARYSISCTKGAALAEALVIRVLDASGNVVEEFEGIDEFVSAWETLPVGNNMTNPTIEIELPVSAGNKYQHNALVKADPNYDGVAIQIFVEAVQGNGTIN